jgi:hypothetical protein
VKISIEPFGREHEAGAIAFNRRLRDANAPTPFLLPTHAASSVRAGSVTVTQYVAVDEHRDVRGGVLCQEHPALAGQKAERTINLQSPLSEGIIDPAYTFVAPQLVKHALSQTPYAYVVGMGNATAPLPRLLKAMGWTINRVPFYFRIIRGARCVRHLSPLRNSRVKRLAGGIAAMTGIAALGTRVVHRASSEVQQTASRFHVEPIQHWSEWANAAWDEFAPALSFGVHRTTDVLPFFYSFDADSPRAWALKRDGGAIEGWFGMLTSSMAGNPYFGNLVVATLTDCVGTQEAVRAGIALAIEQAKAQGADLLITNQQHRLLRDSCTAAGWRQGPSNYLMATSRVLTERFDEATAYITRRDGDGLTNLGG